MDLPDKKPSGFVIKFSVPAEVVPVPAFEFAGIST